MISRSSTLIRASLLSALTLASSSALAQDPAAPAPPREEAPAFKPLALTLNPISLLIGRFGLNVEYLPAPHHGIMLNPYFSSQSTEVGSSKTSYRSFGAEIGYHFYTGSKGANGFFVGPQLVYIRAGSEVSCAGCQTAKADFSAYGVAVDLGGQHVFDNGFTIGGGAGLMYLKAGADGKSGATSSTIKFDGTLPRFLFMVGYSF